MRSLNFNRNSSGEDLEYGMQTIFEQELDIADDENEDIPEGFQIVDPENL